LSDELTNPNRTCVGFRSGAANIPEQPNGQQRIGRHLPDASLLAGVGKYLGEVSALEGFGVISLPNVMIAVGELRQVKVTLPFHTSGNHGLSRQLTFTTMALSGLAPRRN